MKLKYLNMIKNYLKTEFKILKTFGFTNTKYSTLYELETVAQGFKESRLNYNRFYRPYHAEC